MTTPHEAHEAQKAQEEHEAPAGPPAWQFGVSEFTTQPWPFERDVATYARLGVAVIEVCEDKLDPDRLREQLASIGAAGLAIGSVQPSVRTLFPSLSQPEPREVPARLAYFKRTIERFVGAGATRESLAFVTNTGIAPRGNLQQVWDSAVPAYQELADYARGSGARIAFEPLNAAIMNIESAIWTLEQARQLVAQVGRENFGICLDYWNIWQNAEIGAQIRACGDHIFVVQVSDWRTPRSFQDRLVVGQGTIPLPALLRATHESGYRGAYSVEIFSSGVPQALWEGDLEQVIRDSRAGLESAWRAAFAGP